MKKKELVFVFFLLFAASLFVVNFLFREKDEPTADTVLINELVKLTEQNFDQLTTDIYPVTEVDFSVIDNMGKLHYTTKERKACSYEEYLNEAIANYDIILDITIDEQIVGKLIIKNSSRLKLDQERQQLLHNMIICFAIMSILILGYLFYLDRKLFRPFYSLQRFASSVAAGNLDIPIKMDKKNLFGAFTESFDLMRTSLQTARQNEYLANKSKKELVASLSHDIKNPVASIKAICETMALDLEDARITTIIQKAEQIDELISDMFVSTLDELGELKVRNEELESNILADIFEGINYYNKIKIVTPLPSCLIFCDRLRLTQIIDNLAGNSYKYAGTEIYVSFELTDRFFIIKMKDFGNGIPEDELPMVCEKFYRAKNSEGKDGAGLGLYLSRLFIEKMGGQMECLNEIDGFTVMFGLRLVGKD